MDHSSDVMACSTAACERIFDVAVIIADRTSIWTSFGLASYMVFFSFDHAVYINTNIVAVCLIVSGSSCSTRPIACSHHAFAFGPRTHYVHTVPSTFPSPTVPTVPTALPPPTPSPASTPPPTSTMPPTPLPKSPYPPHPIQPPLQTDALMVSPDEPPPRPPAVKATPRPRSDKRIDRPRRPASKSPSFEYTTNTQGSTDVIRATRTGRIGFHYTATCGIGSTYSSSATSDHGYPTSPKTKSATSPTRWTSTEP